MIMNSQGKIINPAGFNQKIVWGGLNWPAASGRSIITPTDIDVFTDFGNEFFVFAEIKHEDAHFGGGQRLALERLIDALQEGGKEAILLHLTHDTPSNENVDAFSCIVQGIYYKRVWQESMGLTPKETIDHYLVLTGLYDLHRTSESGDSK